MRIIWTRPALRDRERHFLYLAERNPAAALRVDDAIREAVERLAEFPHRGRPGQRAGTRELVISEFPTYLVVYQVTETAVRILRVWHGRQDWQRR